MCWLSRAKKYMPGSSKKKASSRPDQKNVNDTANERPDSAKPAQSSSTHTTPIKSNKDLDLWAQAYRLLQERLPDLLADYTRHLASLPDVPIGAADLFSLPFVEDILKEHLKTREDKQWKVSLLGKDIKIRKQSEKLVKFLLWTDPIVKNAVSAQPYAALAWTGVSMLLPLLTSGTTQNEAMLKGFESTSRVQLYWDVCEKTYLRSEHQKTYEAIFDPLTKLYSQIIEYQALAICHLSKAQLSRAWENVAGSNGWLGMNEDIITASRQCSKIIPHLNEEEIRERCERQWQTMQESNDLLNKIHQALKESGALTQKIYQDQTQRELQESLSTHASDYTAFKNLNPKRVPDTCEWFLRDEQFRSWRANNTSSILWVSTGPGCGKSVLSRTLVDEHRLSIDATTSTICQFFFKDGDARRMHSSHALCAILHQLFKQDRTGTLIQKALPSFDNHGKALPERPDELWHILEDCAKSPEAGEIVCIIDALDECDDSRTPLIDKLIQFYLDKSSETSKLKFIITSRAYPDLATPFENLSGKTMYWHINGDSDTKSEEITKEIDLVIDAKLEGITSGFTEADRQKISERLKSMGNRTYLWLHLTFDAIEHSRKRSDAEAILGELSDTVSDQYERLLGRSTNQNQTEILLRIVLAALRPLTLDEANIALTMAVQEEHFTSHAKLQEALWPRKNFEKKVKDLCGLFLSIHDSKLSFIHQTAREFLTQNERRGTWQGRLRLPASHRTISLPCLHYLLLPEIETSAAEEASSNAKYPFLAYAAAHWLAHYRSQQPTNTDVEEQSKTSALVLSLCDPDASSFSIWSYMPPWRSKSLPRGGSTLTIAAALGLEMEVKHLINLRTINVDAQDSDCYTPLTWAIRNEHEKVFKTLLDSGKVTIEPKYDHGLTPFMLAVEWRREDMAMVLFNTGKVDVNFKSGWGESEKRTPLWVAAGYGMTKIVELLLNTGKVNNINWKNSFGQTPLSLAAGAGYNTIVQLLLAMDEIDIDSKDHRGKTPLRCAVEEGIEAAVKLLLDTHKVDVDSKDVQGRTPFGIAALIGDEGIFKMLLDTNEVDVDWKDNYGDTPLLFAVSRGHEKVVKQLLDTGKVDMNLRKRHNHTPLLIAVSEGKETIVNQLLDTGKVDNHTPLMIAISKENEKIVQLLLDTGKVDMSLRNGDNHTALMMAITKGNETIVKLLLKTGKVDVDGEDISHAVLMARSHSEEPGRHEIVKMLREYDSSRLATSDLTPLPL